MAFRMVPMTSHPFADWTIVSLSRWRESFFCLPQPQSVSTLIATRVAPSSSGMYCLSGRTRTAAGALARSQHGILLARTD